MKWTAALGTMIALAFIAMAPDPAPAQENQTGGSVKLTPFEARGIKLSTIYTVDGDFANRHGVDVPAAFSLAAPRLEGQQIHAQAKPSGGGPIKIYFITDDGEKRVFSSLQIVTYSLKIP